MNYEPLLSFIVLSYNYKKYIAQTIQSILEQTIQDFEIIVVDDCSQDDSINVIRSFNDPRIHLLCNEKNIGGAASYNRALSVAKGKWLVTLDADDWIVPHKSERQLAAIATNPDLDIIGTYVSVFDENSMPHRNAWKVESVANVTSDFNQLDTWIGQNHLCRSSTMIRRVAHQRLGLLDPNMIRAPDFEIWTRALRYGCRFAVIPEKLTCIRSHLKGVTHGDPKATFWELSYGMYANLIPLAEQKSLYSSIKRIIDWIYQNQNFHLLPIEQYRLLGMLLQSNTKTDFKNFKAIIQNQDDRPELTIIGRRYLAMLSMSMATYRLRYKIADWIMDGLKRLTPRFTAFVIFYFLKLNYWRKSMRRDSHKSLTTPKMSI